MPADDANAWETFYRRLGRRALATRAPTDDLQYFTSGCRELIGIMRRFTVPQTGTALEIGCGDGRMTRNLALQYDRVIALDVAPSVLDACRTTCAGFTNVEFMLGGSAALETVDSRTVDFVLSATVLQHVQDKAEILRYVSEADRLLTRGGVAALQLRNPAFRTRLRDLAVDTARVATHSALPSYHRGWRGARVTEWEARRAVDRPYDGVQWHTDRHHAWLRIDGRYRFNSVVWT